MDTLEYLLNKNIECIWKYDNSSNEYSQPWTTEGWKEYEDYFKKELEKGAKLLLPYFFIDEFQSASKKKKMTSGVYMGVANFLKRVSSKIRRNLLISAKTIDLSYSL